MKAALLLIDLQQDFLSRPLLSPPPSRLIQNTGLLLKGFRKLGQPVCHIHTIMKSDGSDLIPHWLENNYSACLEGSQGCRPPAELSPQPEEQVFSKRFFNGFADANLEPFLRSLTVDTLIIAGLYLHACIRTTALAAYELGFKVWIAEDCVGSYDPLHSSVSRTYMEERTLHFLEAKEVLSRINNKKAGRQKSNLPAVPYALTDNKWLEGRHLPLYEHFIPARADTLSDSVPLADREAVEIAAASSKESSVLWESSTPGERGDLLHKWARLLEKKKAGIADLMAVEIGKPIRDGLEEMKRAVAHVRSAAELLNKTEAKELDSPPSVTVRNCPLGPVAIITPWNNPAAIPAAKISAALGAGDTVVWKPALQAPRTSMALMNSLVEAGLKPGMVNCLFGDKETSRNLICHPSISAVSLTGSTETGRMVSGLCSHLGKPLQAELGGNNAALVMADCHIASTVEALTASAFGFAGQRCTASRRIILDKKIAKRFLDAFIPAVEEIKTGDPKSPDTRMGPLVSAEQLDLVKGIIERALKQKGKLLCGGDSGKDLSNGFWLKPTLIHTDEAESELVQEETFGPLAVIMIARDFDHAMELCNKVQYGLVASIYTADQDMQNAFIKSAEAGILRINQGSFQVHPEAPFGGWKASSIGPPEHGIWDSFFYSRLQAIYGDTQ